MNHIHRICRSLASLTRRATAAAAGKAAHESRTRPAAAHHPGLHPVPGEPGRVLGQPHRRQDGTQALVPVLLRGTGPGPLRHDPVRELARCHAGHDAQVPAPRHADPGSPAKKAGVRADPPHLRWSQPGIGDAAPGPCRAVNVAGSEYPPSPATTFLHASLPNPYTPVTAGSLVASRSERPVLRVSNRRYRRDRSSTERRLLARLTMDNSHAK